MVLPAALGHISLCENQFCIYDLHSSVSDAAHLSDPFHLVAGFQFFRNSLCICRLFCKPKKKFFCLPVNIRNIALTREMLITNVWGYDFYGDDRTLDTHIKLLRRSLGPYSKFIVTLRGVGYRFETHGA